MTKTLKTLMTEKALQEKLKVYIASRKECPNYFDFFKSAGIDLIEALDINNIPSVSYMEDTSSSTFYNNINGIKTWLRLAGETLEPVIEEYDSLTRAYQNIVMRISNETPIFKDKIDKILRPYCYPINSRIADQTDESNSGKIGKFITLPFFMSSSEVYNDRLYLKVTSTGDIVFSNVSNIRKLPLSTWAGIKIQGGAEEFATLSGVLSEEIPCNAMYIKFMNDVYEIRLSLYSANGDNVFTSTYRDNEILANFEPVNFKSFSINLKYRNPNTDKPFAIQLAALEIFKKLHFARTGTFESTQKEIVSGDETNSINIQYVNDGDKSKTNIRSLLSISADSTIHDYNIIDEDSSIDISIHKFRHHRTYDQLGIESDSTINIKYPDDNSDRFFYKINIDQTLEPDYWNTNFEKAIVFHGLAKEYARTTDSYAAQSDLIYENWTKVGNYWITMVIIYDDSVILDIGQCVVAINGREQTGKIKFEKGIFVISVHKKYIDFKFGKSSIADLDVTNQTRIQSDPLFPFNFAYMLAGLPDFTTDGNLAEQSDRNFEVYGGRTSTIILGEPFIPLTMDIVDSNNIPYELVLTSGVSEPGTFNVEPFGGKVKVAALDNATSVSIKYRRANPFRRPVGILFNRLLTFMPIKTLIGLSWRDDMFFSLDGSQTSRFLLLQHIPNKNISHSQIIYNRTDENIYSSIKLEMETTNRYLTPIIKDIFLIAG